MTKKLATVDISDLHNPLPSKDTPYKHRHGWYVTISTNVRMGNAHPEIDDFGKAIREVLFAMVNDEDELKSILVINGKIDKDSTPFDAGDSTFVVERGPQLGLMHAHGLVDIKSKIKNVKLSYTKIPDYLKLAIIRKCREMGLQTKPTGIMFDARFLGADELKPLTDKQRILDYIRKNMKEPEVTMKIVGEETAKKRKAMEITSEKEEDAETKHTEEFEKEQRIAKLRRIQSQIREEPEDQQGTLLDNEEDGLEDSDDYPIQQEIDYDKWVVENNPNHPHAKEIIARDFWKEAKKRREDKVPFQPLTVEHVESPPKADPAEKVPFVKLQVPQLD